MNKLEKEYQELYGDIPSGNLERFDYLLSTLKNKRFKVSINDTIKHIQNIKWKKVSFVVYLLPKATPRPRSGRNGVFYVKGAKDNKQIFQKFMLENPDLPFITTPCKFYCKSYFPIPRSSMKPVEQICAELGFIKPISKPDWDNVAKAYCDMTQGTLLYDDSLIIEGHSYKYYSVKPRIEITIEYMEEFDCDFNYKKIRGKDKK